MDVTRAEKKIREAEFFLAQLRHQIDEGYGAEGFGLEEELKREKVDFCLSAALSAIRSVDYSLENQHAKGYKMWRKSWNSNNPADDAILAFFSQDRAAEVHLGGSMRTETEVDKALRIGEYRHRGARMIVTGPPDVSPLATVPTVEYSFTMPDGVQRELSAACEICLKVLRRMVNDLGNTTSFPAVTAPAP